MIEKWEHRRREQSYLSLPADGRPRYRVRAQGKRWLAHRVRFVPQITMASTIEYLGSFESAAKAIDYCRKHETGDLHEAT